MLLGIGVRSLAVVVEKDRAKDGEDQTASVVAGENGNGAMALRELLLRGVI